MTKILLSSLAAAVFLTGCACSAHKTEPKTQAQYSHDVTFVGAENSSYRVNLSSNDMFETGVLQADGKKYNLKRAVSASGIRMVGDGAEIMFAKGEGVLNLGGKDISLVYKP